MSEGLDTLARAYGIEPSYVSESGEHRIVSDDVKRRLLGAMLGLAPEDIRRMESAAYPIAEDIEPSFEGSPAHCFVPGWLKEGRAWGITVQLYGIRSARNQGIGDFEDLANLAELSARLGADFIGVNPLHVLFWNEPERCSPYAPSTRQFVNPLYIALDRLPGAQSAFGSITPSVVEQLRRSEMIDYSGVSTLKRRALKQAFTKSATRDDAAFAAFCEDGGHELEQFANFEVISDVMAEKGLPSGWHAWPEGLRSANLPDVARLVADLREDVLWHKWMQWIAAGQLADAQRRARAAGMRIGLYLDLAVGVAPDGAATWSDPELVVGNARIGAPPDQFNPLGQDWGLAPMAPRALLLRSMRPFERDLEAAMRVAGAVRLDHAMGLRRLYWIPEGSDARAGGYVRYPIAAMLDSLGRLSHRYSAIVIGEDLGTVPHGFRELMRENEIHSYRVFYFERAADGSFAGPEAYLQAALACIGTHDLPTLRGWWTGSDIAARAMLGVHDSETATAAHADRHVSRRHLLTSLNRGEAATANDLPHSLPDDFIIALHALVANSRCRLFAAQIEDLAGAVEQVNLPGTHTEYPNWRRKLPVDLEELADFSLFSRTVAVIAESRPRSS